MVDFSTSYHHRAKRILASSATEYYITVFNNESSSKYGRVLKIVVTISGITITDNLDFSYQTIELRSSD